MILQPNQLLHRNRRVYVAVTRYFNRKRLVVVRRKAVVHCGEMVSKSLATGSQSARNPSKVQ